jgi:CheY-like chemotaxis protein
VKAMGGALELQSEEGKGSIFSFDLRFAIAPSNAMLEIAEASTAVPAPQLPHSHSSSFQPEISKRLLGLRILVAEDQPLNRMVVERILELEGANVEMVDDGLKAVNAVQQAHQQGHLFDAVLMDIQMPVLSGLEATRAIRNKPGLGSDQLPILAVTANVMAEDVLNCLDAGMNGHIPKPVNADELVRQLLASTAKA